MELKEFKHPNDVLEFPICSSEEKRLKTIEEYLDYGAIAKEDLIPGAWYIGNSRSTNIAQWFPKGGFHFPRYKMSGHYIDNIPHFSDNVNTDVFIPIKMIEL